MFNLNAKRQQGMAVVAAMTALCLPISASAQQASTTVMPADAASQGMVLPGFEWSLPAECKLNSAGQRVQPTVRLTGSVTRWNVDADFSQLIDAMLDGATAGMPEAAKLDKAVAHFRTNFSERVAKAKEGANFLIPSRGFGPSSEAADVILDEKIKVKDRASAEYARQRLIDDLHPQVIERTMQLAMALGMKDAVQREEMVNNAMEKLQKLVGKSAAEGALHKMEAWAKYPVPPAIYANANSMDVDKYQTSLKQSVKLAMDGDPVMRQIVDQLKKYNHKNAASRASCKVVQGTLSVASWAAPGWILPAAIELVNMGYTLATGGSEESKLLKELYYDKRIESRYRAITDETQLAFAQYQAALASHNPVLLMCCESVLAQLVGSENIGSVLGGQTLLAHEDEKKLTASNSRPMQ